MASNIVPGNVDGTYPIAGQDNSSQGFRDNFAAIVTNFTNAKTEIEDLQSNKANTNAASDFTDNLVKRAVLQDTAETISESTETGHQPQYSGTMETYLQSLQRVTKK